MVDFEFYKNCYLGSRIPEKAFDAAMLRAEEYLAYLSRICRVVSAGEESRKMALCAMAEEFYGDYRCGGVRSAKVGDVSVNYREDSGGSLNNRLLQCASIYLDIYRGVDGWSS